MSEVWPIRSPGRRRWWTQNGLPDDSRLDNVWQEYKVQVQLEQRLFFSFYSDTIRRIVEEAVDSMHPKTLAALSRLTAEAEQWGARKSGCTPHC